MRVEQHEDITIVGGITDEHLSTTLDLILRHDGVSVILKDPFALDCSDINGREISIYFEHKGKNHLIAQKLKELVELLAEESVKPPTE